MTDAGNALVAHAHSSEHNEHYTPEWITTRADAVLEGITFDPFSSARANETVRAERYWTIDTWSAFQGGATNAFRLPWCGLVPDADVVALPSRVWCNPPGGRLDADTLAPLPRNEEGRQGGPGLSAAGAAFAKLSHEWALGRVDCALFLAFSLNVFRTAQALELTKHFPRACAPASFPFMVFRDRIKFETIDPDTGVRTSSGAGTPQDSAIIFLPPRLYQTQRAGISTHDVQRYRQTRDVHAEALGRFKQQFQDQGHVRL